MNTRKLLVSVLMLVCVMLSACAPAVPATHVPTSLPPTVASTTTSTFSGDPIPEKYLNVDYNLMGGDVPIVMRFYAPDDPICLELKTQGNCFTQLNSAHDPKVDTGARGRAALINGLLAQKFQLCPNCGPEEGTATEYFEPREEGGVLVGVKCETKTGESCNFDVGTTWKPEAQKSTFQSSDFEVPMSFTYGPDWAVHEWAKNAIDIVYNDLWGTSMLLVNGALVHDPVDMISAEPAAADKTKFVAFPADYFAYITSLPGVEVIQGPEQVTIGGVQGSQVIVHTPGMHPLLWLKDDVTWLGGGKTGIDPDFKRLMILLEVNGERVLLEFDDSPEKFDERYPFVQEIFNSITFGK